ncbi:GTPase-activating protein [Oleoguttula sp. CCFEE 5521]
MQSFLQYRRIQIAAKQRISSQKETPPTRSSDEPETGVAHYLQNGHAVPLERMPNDAAATSVEKSNCNDGEKPSAIDHEVAFDSPHDPQPPLNWPLWKKFLTNGLTACVAFTAGFGSSIAAPIIPQAAAEFHVSEAAESLATVLFLVGFGIGAPFAGPLSEAFGRNPVYIGTLALFCCWVLGAALSPNLGAQLVFKFLSGLFGSTAFTTAGGTLGDTFDHQMRGKIFPWFGAVALFGPVIAPVVGAYVGQSGMDWRWVD